MTDKIYDPDGAEDRMLEFEKLNTITLRLKDDHEVVLPPGRPYEPLSEDPSHYNVMLNPKSNVVNKFPRDEWEPVPPPYELPTGFGAVVRNERLSGGLEREVFVRVLANSWRSKLTGREWSNEGLLQLGTENLTTLSEGVEL